MLPKGFKHSEESKRKIAEGQRRYYRMKIEQNPVYERVVEPVDEKTCTGCGETKPIGEFYIKRRKMKCGLIHAYPEASCKQCRRERFKKNYEGLSPEARREKWQRNSAVRDPDKLRQYGREWAAARRRKEGAKSNGPWRKYREEGFGPLLHASPFVTFIREELERQSVLGLARELGVDDKRVRDWRDETYSQIGLGTVDLVLTKLGQPWRLHELYPVEEDKPLYGYFKP